MTQLALTIFTFLFLPFTLSAQTITINDYPVEKVTPNAYVIHGPLSVPDEKNLGFMNNPGFVITEKGVVVIDPGGVIEAGEMVLRAIKNITDKPVIAVFNTHIHADHWFGNGAIAKAFPNVPIYAHQNTLFEAQITGQTWLGTVASLTKSNHHKKNVVIANKAVKHGDVINIGGAKFEIFHYDVMHTRTDIMISVNDGEILFLGDNLFNGRINQHAEGHIKKTWEGVERAAKASQAKVFVPGHGKTGDISMLSFALNAHKLLYQSVETQFEDDVSDFEMRPVIEPLLKDYKEWAEFERLLGKVINKAYLEIEEAAF